VTDGLQSNEFNAGACYVNENGELFFGGIDGFNAFFPENIRDNPTIPPVVLTSLVHGDEQVNLEQDGKDQTEITLKWPDNSFEFTYAALSYAQPEKNQYAYYLEGFEETWNEVGTRQFGSYTNLSGGTYTLRVKGSNNDGVWNNIGTSLTITVVPPFWGTLWFRGLVLLAVLGILYGGYRLRVRTLEMRERELESLVEQRTAELLETQEALRLSELDKAITEERSRLARELHDSVTQSLHSSTLMAEAGQRLAGVGEIERARGYLVRLGEISQQALREMRLLVYELRPLALRGIGLVGALQQRLDAVERRSGIDVQLSIEEDPELPRNIEEELFRVAMEALNNALKHANPSTVTVTLQKVESRATPCVELAIIDDGTGFDPDANDDIGGLGLISMQQRIENLGGDLTIISAPGEGTQVKVCVELNE
jgi:signal transduction histidine kinase